MEPLANPNVFAIKGCTEQESQKQNPPLESRVMEIFRFQPHLCVQPTVGAKAHKELLFEVPSPRIISLSKRTKDPAQRQFCVSKPILHLFRSIRARKRYFSTNFRHVCVSNGDLDLTKTDRKQIFWNPIVYPELFSVKSCAK